MIYNMGRKHKKKTHKTNIYVIPELRSNNSDNLHKISKNDKNIFPDFEICFAQPISERDI